MTSFSSSSVCMLAFLLLSIFLVSASTDDENNAVILPPDAENIAVILPSPEVGSVTESNICKPEDVSRDEVWGPTQDCNICTFYCAGVCAGMGSQTDKKACIPRKRAKQIVCQCCCTKPPSPPPPTPPSPPPPMPFEEKCVKQGGIQKVTSMLTQDCTDCRTGCKDTCSEENEDGDSIDYGCAIDPSSSQARICDCCCRSNSKPPAPSPPPPTPFEEKCVNQGDKYYNGTNASDKCAECTEWCKDVECPKKGGYMVDDFCEKRSETDFLRHCECCCRDNSKPPPSPSSPTLGCPSEAKWTIPGVKPCSYRLVSSPSSSSSITITSINVD